YDKLLKASGGHATARLSMSLRILRPLAQTHDARHLVTCIPPDRGHVTPQSCGRSAASVTHGFRAPRAKRRPRAAASGSEHSGRPGLPVGVDIAARPTSPYVPEYR